MSIFFTSDHHFGDNRFQLMGRPFTDIKEMADYQIDLYNKVIKSDDTVYHLGDLTYWKRIDLINIADRLNGHKHLFLGNHDFAPIKEYMKHFETVQLKKDLDVKDDTTNEIIKLHLVHYPVWGISDRFNLVGHIHSAWRIQRNMINIGVDAWHFRPVSLEEVLKYIRVIKGFYDDDVFAGELKCNLDHVENTGTEGSRADLPLIYKQKTEIKKYNSDI